MKPPGDDRSRAGWRSDPRRAEDQRYWDGRRWSSMRATPLHEGEPIGTPPRRPGRRRRTTLAALTGLVVIGLLGVLVAVLVLGRSTHDADSGGEVPAGVTGLAVGTTTSCALQDAQVWCWGGSVDEPARVQSLSDVVELAGSEDRYCTRDRSGVITCWTGSAPSVLEQGPEDLEDLAAGATHACGLRGGQAWCWGDGDAGQLGDRGPGADGADGQGSSGDSNTGGGALASAPVRVDLDDAVDVAVAGTWSCAVLASGQVWCWGTGPTEGVQPAAVAGLSGATQVALAEDHGCAVVAQGTVRCWGGDTGGVLGDGAADQGERLGGRVVGLSGVGSIATGRFSSCAVADDRVECWGDNALGQLGVGERSAPRRRPVPVELDEPVQQVAVGALHACALDIEGAVWCWGGSGQGQTGAGRSRSTPTPRQVPLG